MGKRLSNTQAELNKCIEKTACLTSVHKHRITHMHIWSQILCNSNYLRWQKQFLEIWTIFQLWLFCLIHVPSANMDQGLWLMLQPATRWQTRSVSYTLGSCHVAHLYLRSMVKTQAALCFHKEKHTGKLYANNNRYSVSAPGSQVYCFHSWMCFLPRGQHWISYYNFYALPSLQLVTGVA